MLVTDPPVCELEPLRRYPGGKTLQGDCVIKLLLSRCSTQTWDGDLNIGIEEAKSDRSQAGPEFMKLRSPLSEAWSLSHETPSQTNKQNAPTISQEFQSTYKQLSRIGAGWVPRGPTLGSAILFFLGAFFQKETTHSACSRPKF